MLKIVFFVPPSHLEQVKEALFNIGAGQSNHYSHCSWQTLGTMQYKAEAGSHPTKGNKNEYTVTAEYRVELVCQEKIIKKAIKTLKKAHPYEVPAFEIYKLETDPTEIK